MDDSTFKTFFEATKGPLLAYLRQSAGQALAEDVLQETFIRFLSKPPREASPGAWRNWVFTTATRLLRDHWRKERHLSWWPWGTDEGDRIPEPPSPSCVERHVWSRQVIEHGFRSLSSRQRTLLWLAHVEGFNHEELGQALCITPGSARVLLHRARNGMQQALLTLRITGDAP